MKSGISCNILPELLLPHITVTRSSDDVTGDFPYFDFSHNWPLKKELRYMLAFRS